jgi:hypothetical protein
MIVQTLSDNLEQYSQFSERLFSVLKIDKEEFKNQIFLLALIRNLVDFAVAEGNKNVCLPVELEKDIEADNYSQLHNNVVSEKSFNIIKNTFNEYVLHK